MKPEDNSLESGYESSQYDPSLDDQSIKVNSQLSVNNRRHIALSLFKFDRKATLISVAVVILIILIGGGVFLFFKNNSQLSLNNQQPNNLYKVGSNLSVTQASSSQVLRLGQSSQLAINGQLTVNKNLVLTPSTLPVSPIIGEIYYDKSSNKPFYYNGSKFISLVSTVSPQTLARQAVTSLGGVAGAIGIGSGLLFNGNTLSISNLLIQSIDSSAAAITGGSLSGGNLSSTNLQFTGSSGTINESGNNTNLTINSMGSGILSLDSTGLGTVDVGNTNASAVNIGNNSSASLLEGRSVSIQSGAGDLSLATGSSGGNLYLKTNNSSSGAIVQSLTNSATAFQIQNASGTSLLTADTSNNSIDIGTIGTPTGQLYVSGTIPTYVGENTDTNMNGPTSTYIQGNYVYVTSPYSNKLVVYNISNPSNPTYVGENSDSNLDKPWNVYVQGNYAYVINSNNNNLVVYNISNPSNPTYVGKNASNNGPSSVYVQGNYAYVTSYKSNKLVVYNISNPSNPTYVGENSDSNLNGPVSVVVQGIYAYVTSYNSNKLVVYNISNPSNPTYVGENSDSNLNGPNYVYVQGNYAYVTSYNSNKLVVYNIGGAYIQQLQTGGIQTSNLNVLGNSNLNGDLGIQGGLSVGTNAEINNSLGVGGSATFQDATNSATAFQIQNASGTSLLTADTSNNRIDIGTIGTPTGQLYVSGSLPTLESTTSTNSGPDSVYVSGIYAYVINSSASTLQIFNITDPASPTLESTTSTNSDPNSVYVSGIYAYVINSSTTLNQNNLQIFNITDPASPILVGSIASSYYNPSVFVSGNYAYVAKYGYNMLEIYNISVPSNPTFVGSSGTLYHASSVFVSGNYAYVTNVDSQGTAYNTLQIFNISNPANPISVGSINTGVHPSSVYVSGNFAYVASYGSNLLEVYNISNPSNPTLVGSVATGSGPFAVYVQGNYAYVVNSTSNTLAIYNIGGAYIQQLQTGGIQTSNLNVLGNSNLNGDLGIQGGLSVGTNAEINNSLGVGGSATFQDATNSATAFQVQNASGDNVFNVNTNTGITSSISEVNGWSSSGTNNSTLSDSPAALGDLVVLAIKYGNTAINVTGISGGGVTNWHLVTSGSSTANSTSESLWEGTVSSIGPSTISVNFSSSTGTLNDIDAQEFSSGLGLNTSWSVESSGFLPTTTASTTSSLPLLTAQASNELYWGYIQSSSTVTGLSTSGFNITIDSQGNAMVYNTSTVSNTSYQPVVTLNSSGTSNAISMIISASGISQGVNVSGNFLVQSTVNEATAFQVQNASGVNLLSVDTSSDMINIHGALNFNQSSDVASIDLNHSPVLNVNVNLANTSLGSSTLQSDTSGSSNSALGLSALSSNTTGNENSAVGRAALLNNTTGNGNSAVGLWSLINNTTGNGNSAVGFWSLVNNSTGSENSAVGSFALDSINSGSNNSALGFEAGFRDVGGNFATLSNIQNATAIGAYAQVQENNAIVLGSVDNPTLVGIGTTVPLNTFSVSPLDYNTGTASQVSGSDVVTGTGTTWTSSMVGDELIFADGTQELITGFTSATSLTGSSTSISETNSYYRLHYIGLQVTNTGNVGIGTSNPNYNLDIQGTSGEMIQTTTNTATAFQVQNAAGVDILGVDTTFGSVLLGTGGVINGSLTVYNSTNTNTVTLESGVTTASYTLYLPTAAPSSTGQCLGDPTSTDQLGYINCGTVKGGNTANIMINAKYPGSVFDSASDSSCSSSNTGTMTNGYDNSISPPQNYYQWTTTQTTSECEDIVVQVPLPSDFGSFVTTGNSFEIYATNSSGTNSTAVAVEAIQCNGSADSAFGGNYVGISSGTSWAQTSLSASTDSFTSSNYTSCGYLTLKIRLTASNNSTVQIGNIDIPYVTSTTNN